MDTHHRSSHASRSTALILAAVLVAPLVGSTAAGAQHREPGYSGAYEGRDRHRGRDNRQYDRRDRRHDRHYVRRDRRDRHPRHDRHDRRRQRHDGHDSYYRRGEHGSYGPRHEVRGPRHGTRGHRQFEVPRRVHRTHYERYAPYFYGTVFYGPHRHHHRVYHFPVVVDGYATYQPYAYCEGSYYRDHYAGGSLRFGGPRFGFDIRF